MTSADPQPESLLETGSTNSTTEQDQDRVRSRAKRSGDVRREGKFCGCGMQLSLTGVCVNCD